MSSSPAVRFLYGTQVGRMLLQGILRTRADRLAVRFLRSGLSKPLVGRYARKNGIELPQDHPYRCFQSFFCRKQPKQGVDITPDHLISPCDGWLSLFPIAADSSFLVKGSQYKLADLLEDPTASEVFCGGDCLIFRLTPSDYHRYCYVDSGFQEENHFIEGALHSVQDAACRRYPVYVLNRRCRTLFQTEHFGRVAQIEVGAMVVGGIVNHRENCQIRKGEEMGYFDLAGSSIVMLFQSGQIKLLPDIMEGLAGAKEVRVEYGRQIGTALRQS